MIRIILFLVLISSIVHLAQAQDSVSPKDSSIHEGFLPWEVILDEMVIEENSHASHDLVKSLQESSKNTDQILHGLPGMSMMSKGNYAHEPTLRGLTEGRLFVTIDGMRIFGACTDKMDPVSSYIETNNLAGIQLSLTDSYQSNSTAINLNLKKPIFNEEDKVRGNTGVFYASAANEFSQKADVNISQKDNALRLSLGHRKAGDYRGSQGRFIKHSAFEKVNYSLSVAHKTSFDQLFTASFLGDNAWDVGYPALTMDVAFARANILSLEFYDPTVNESLKDLELKIYFNHINHSMDDTGRENVAMHMDMPGKTLTHGFIAQTAFGTSEKWSYKGKLDYYSTYAHAEMTMYPDVGKPMFMLTWPDVFRHSVTLSVKAIRQISKKAGITISSNTEGANTSTNSELGEKQFSVFNRSVLTRHYELLGDLNLAVNYVLNSNTGIEMRYGVDQRLPNTSEQYGYYLYNRYDGFDYIGNPDIQKETALKGDLSTRFEKEKLTWKINLFHYYFRNYILGLSDPVLSTMTPGAHGVKTYRNIPHAQLMGLEFTGTYKVSERTRGLITGGFNYGIDHESRPLPMIPPLEATLVINQKVKSIWLRGEMKSAARQKRVSQAFSETATPGFVVFNLSMTGNLPLKSTKWNWSAGINNITDRAYQEHLDWGNIPRPGRSVYGSLDFRF